MGRGKGSSDTRERRLAEALRANLKRRKEQSRARCRPEVRDTGEDRERGKPHDHDSDMRARLTCPQNEGL